MTVPTARAVMAGLAAAAAMTLAWLIPVVAPILVWPLLLVLPGWAILALLRPRIDLAGRIGLAVVGSVALSTHLVYWVSHLVGGYGRTAVFIAAAVLAVIVVAAVGRTGIGPRVRPVRSTSGVVLVAVIAAVFVGLTLSVGLWRSTPAGIVSGGSNWSDLGVHLSIAQTLNAGGNFPPEVPYFAGEPLVYHWFADFHAAMLAEAGGIFSVPAMVVQSAILSGALALLAGSLARRVVVDRRSRVATVTAILVVFGGGLGYVRLVGDLVAGVGAPLELIARNSYDNQWLTDWPYFRIPSVMSTGLLAHRATTAGLPMLVGAILLVIAAAPTRGMAARGWHDRPALLVAAGSLGAMLAPFHFFFLPLVPLLAVAWAAAGGRLLDPAIFRNAALFAAPYLLALPFAVAPALQSAGSGSLRLVALWPAAPREDGLLAVAFFYLTNFGVPLALAIVALLGRVPHRRFLAAWTVGLFIVPNVVAVSVVDFDMNKVFQAMWVAVAVAAAWLVRRWPAWAVALVVGLSVPSPLLVAAWTATSNLQVISRADAEAAAWVADNTPPDAVFVTDGWLNSLTDSAGRKRLTTFGPYIANLGYDPDARIADVTAIYCGGDARTSVELMRRYGATYLVDGGRPQPCPSPVDFATAPELELVYGKGPLIWRLVDG